MEDAVSTVFRCSPAVARELLPVFSARTVQAKHILANQGGTSKLCWIVIDGAIRVDAVGANGQLQQLSQYGPGEFFGAYPEATLQRADISAAVRTLLLCAEGPRLANSVAQHSELGAGMAHLLARQLDRTLDRMVMRSTCSAAGRVYAEILALAGTSREIAPPPRVTMLALAANTTRETASRAIAVLVRRGIITRDDDRIVINSPRLIAELVC